jgi:propionate CoA-transferase
MNKFTDVTTALSRIPDGATLGVTGFRWAGATEVLLRELGDRFRKTGRPRDLTLVFSSTSGGGPGTGLEHLAQSGLLKRVIGGFWGVTPQLYDLAMRNLVEAYNLPQGQIARLYHAIAAGQPGVVTQIGLGTYVDPRHGGGRLNSRSTADLSEVVTLRGREWLLYKSFPVSVGFIRATTADDAGNLTLEKEALTTESLALALAVHNSGGRVIAQVLRRVRRGTLHPRAVAIPGCVVDDVIIATDPETEHRQCVESVYDPRLNGDLGGDQFTAAHVNLEPIRRQVAQRAILEVRPGQIVNLGQGFPSDVGVLGRESGLASEAFFSVESGVIGGIPKPVPDFGIAQHPEAILRQDDQFTFYNGGGLDVALLGFAEMDALGNVNASYLAGRAIGCGGFLDIAVSTRRLVFCGAFSAGPSEIGFDGGTITIRRDGPIQKFVNTLQQVTFNAGRGRAGEQPTLVVTERCVFELRADGLCLTEVAPGVDVRRDILSRMAFAPSVADQIRPMPVAG